MSLNKEASLIANTLNQPDNHELKERIKDLFKSEVALIINKLANNGISRDLVIGYDAELETVNTYIPNTNIISGSKTKTKFKVPSAVRIRSDAQYLEVSSLDRIISLPMRFPIEGNIMELYSDVGNPYSYYISNGYLIINSTSNKFPSSHIHIEGIFESPEIVLSMYDDVDGQDIELPISLDIRAMIRTNILKTLASTGIIDDKNVKSKEQ